SDNVLGGGIFCNDRGTVSHCTAINNRGGPGFGGGDNCVIKECTSVSNLFGGIAVSSKCRLVENSCSENGEYGIYADGPRSRIDSNHVVHNTVGGIRVRPQNGGSLIVRNAAYDNGDNSLNSNFDVPSGNK